MFTPLQYEFFGRGLIVATLVGELCGVIGMYVILRRMSYIVHGLAHAIFGGARCQGCAHDQLLARREHMGITLRSDDKPDHALAQHRRTRGHWNRYPFQRRPHEQKQEPHARLRRRAVWEHSGDRADLPVRDRCGFDGCRSSSLCRIQTPAIHDIRARGGALLRRSNGINRRRIRVTARDSHCRLAAGAVGNDDSSGHRDSSGRGPDVDVEDAAPASGNRIVLWARRPVHELLHTRLVWGLRRSFLGGSLFIALVYSALRQRMASASRGRSHAPGELESLH